MVVEKTINIDAGEHVLKMESIISTCNIDWIGLVLAEENAPVQIIGTKEIANILVTESLDYSVLQEQAITWVEAEDYSDVHWKIWDASDVLELNTIERMNVLGGKTTYNFAWPGQWLEWKINIPEDGNYKLLFRYASGREYNTFYSFYIDELETVVGLKPTGGWGNSSNHYRDVVVEDYVYLKAGEHTLRIEGILVSAVLDWIGYSKVDEPQKNYLILYVIVFIIVVLIFLVIYKFRTIKGLLKRK